LPKDDRNRKYRFEVAKQPQIRAGIENARFRLPLSSAMEIFQLRGPFDLLITDVAVSPINSCDLAAGLVKLKPYLRVVFISGYSDSQSFRYGGLPLGAEDLISKVQVKTEPCG